MAAIELAIDLVRDQFSRESRERHHGIVLVVAVVAHRPQSRQVNAFNAHRSEGMVLVGLHEGCDIDRRALGRGAATARTTLSRPMTCVDRRRVKLFAARTTGGKNSLGSMKGANAHCQKYVP